MPAARGTENWLRLCVQRRLVCSAGIKPAGAKVRRPVAWMAGWRETKTLKPIDPNQSSTCVIAMECDGFGPGIFGVNTIRRAEVAEDRTSLIAANELAIRRGPRIRRRRLHRRQCWRARRSSPQAAKYRFQNWLADVFVATLRTKQVQTRSLDRVEIRCETCDYSINGQRISVFSASHVLIRD